MTFEEKRSKRREEYLRRHGALKPGETVAEFDVRIERDGYDIFCSHLEQKTGASVDFETVKSHTEKLLNDGLSDSSHMNVSFDSSLIDKYFPSEVRHDD